MIKALLNKEFKLAMHPTALLFLGLSAMMFIPNYPLYVTFFYTTLGIFFICLQGRENNDIFYTLMLPVKKSDAVKARFGMVLLLELAQFILAIIAAVIREVFIKSPNEAGMDANIAFFGLALVEVGIFNYFFFIRYYKNTDKVGKAFAVSSTFVWIYIIAAEACCFAVPFFHNKLDTIDPNFLTEKLIVLAIGIVVFTVLTLLSLKKSIKLFGKSDF